MSSSRSAPSHADIDRLLASSAPASSAASATESIMAIDAVSPRKTIEDDDEEAEQRTGLLDQELGVVDYRSIASSRDPRRKRNVLATRAKYYIPSLAWIPQYSWSLLGGDFLAGLTVACILIPQSISYASSLAKLNPATGLISAAIPGIVYAFLGTSRQLNVAPEAALSLLLGQAVQQIRHDMGQEIPEGFDPLGLAIASVITLQAGLFSFMLGFFRLGFIDVVLSRALLRGFITAVAVVILIEQLAPVFGLTKLMRAADPENTLQKLHFIVTHVWEHSNALTTTISALSLSSLVFLRWFKGHFQKTWWIYRLPEVLIVVGLSTFLSGQFRWDKGGVDILGAVSVSTGGRPIEFPLGNNNWKFLHPTTSTAILIAVAGFLDSIVAAKQNGARYGHPISPNRELVALGAANLVGSFFPGALPAYGSITSILLVVYSLIAETPHDVLYYWRMSAWVDLGVMTLTFVLSIVWNLEAGIVVSMVLSLLLVVHRSAKTRMTILGRIPGTDRWKPLKENPEAEEPVSGVLIVRIRENLDFANTAQLKERLRRLELYGIQRLHPSEEPTRQKASVLMFHLADVDSVDASAAQIFHELLEEYRVRWFAPSFTSNRGVDVYLTHVNHRAYKTFAKAGIVELIGVDAFRETVADAIGLVESTPRHTD
ncbi:hypothetical protein MD484_g2366, partial [Candolleomyces efflorescens]